MKTEVEKMKLNEVTIILKFDVISLELSQKGIQIWSGCLDGISSEDLEEIIRLAKETKRKVLEEVVNSENINHLVLD